jgi:hypothetical protein
MRHCIRAVNQKEYARSSVSLHSLWAKQKSTRRISGFQFALSDRRCTTGFRAWIVVIFVVETHLGSNGGHICDFTAFEGKIEQKIGIGLPLRASQKVERQFSDQKQPGL